MSSAEGAAESDQEGVLTVPSPLAASSSTVERSLPSESSSTVVKKSKKVEKRGIKRVIEEHEETEELDVLSLPEVLQLDQCVSEWGEPLDPVPSCYC